MRNLVLFLFISLLSACAGSTLDRGAERVRVSKDEPKEECTELGAVNSHGANAFQFGGNRTGAQYNALKNRAADLGGNYVRLDGVANGFPFGVAFKCGGGK